MPRENINMAELIRNVCFSFLTKPSTGPRTYAWRKIDHYCVCRYLSTYTCLSKKAQVVNNCCLVIFFWMMVLYHLNGGQLFFGLRQGKMVAILQKFQRHFLEWKWLSRDWNFQSLCRASSWRWVITDAGNGLAAYRGPSQYKDVVLPV